MITNFEAITKPLSDEEMIMVPIIQRNMVKYTKERPIKAPAIVAGMRRSGYKMSEPSLRKIVNHLRSTGQMAVIATSSGYYVSNDEEEIRKQIISLRERASAISASADGLERFLTPLPRQLNPREDKDDQIQFNY